MRNGTWCISITGASQPVHNWRKGEKTMIKAEHGKVSVEGTNLDLALDLVSIICSISEDDPTLITLAQVLCTDDLATALKKADMDAVKILVTIIEPAIKAARK